MGRLDWLLRMPAEVERAEERDFGGERIKHLRHAIIIGLIVYNIYNLTSLYLMADIQPFTVAMRLFVLVPGSLAIVRRVPRVAPWLRELLLMGGMFRSTATNASLLMAASPRPICFVMDHRIFRTPVLGWFFRLAKAIPIAPQKEDPAVYEAAIQRAAQALPDVVLLDLSLPGIDGLAALEIRQLLCPDTPFIIVSGSLGEERAVSVLKAGATATEDAASFECR